MPHPHRMRVPEVIHCKNRATVRERRRNCPVQSCTGVVLCGHAHLAAAAAVVVVVAAAATAAVAATAAKDDDEKDHPSTTVVTEKTIVTHNTFPPLIWGSPEIV